MRQICTPMSESQNKVFLYDTTLRDGTQQRGVNFTLDEKLRIAKMLDEFGIPYIECGWPGSNPKDSEFFERARSMKLAQARLVAFGSTRRAKVRAEDDANLQALLRAETPAVAMFGKSWTLHVTDILGAELPQNLDMISESVALLKAEGREVIYDAEHFFDGYRANPEYALRTLKAAVEGGADWIVLCDTNGGSLPEFVAAAVREVSLTVKRPLGIHAHNDSELAVANSLVAVRTGCTQIQGTINGFGERCGNANFCSIIPNLELKLGIQCLPTGKLAGLTELSRTLSELANFNHNTQAPYVGSSAFTHKGGVHVAAVEKIPESYEHVPPESVGNVRDTVVSELSGRGNIRVLAQKIGLDLGDGELDVLAQIKALEREGYQLEHADGTFELCVRRSRQGYQAPFEILALTVVSESSYGKSSNSQAIVKLRVGSEELQTASDGDGPVHAADMAIRKALKVYFPELASVRVADYKVRIGNPHKATQATARVLIEAATESHVWSVVGCSTNVIEASAKALADCYELFLVSDRRHAALEQNSQDSAVNI